MRTAFSKSGPKKSFQSAPNKNAERRYTVDVAQLVRVTDCGSEGRGFEPHLPPLEGLAIQSRDFFFIFRSIASGRNHTSAALKTPRRYLFSTASPLGVKRQYINTVFSRSAD